MQDCNALEMLKDRNTARTGATAGILPQMAFGAYYNSAKARYLPANTESWVQEFAYRWPLVTPILLSDVQSQLVDIDITLAPAGTWFTFPSCHCRGPLP